MKLSGLFYLVIAQIFSKQTSVSAPYGILGVIILLLGLAFFVSFLAKKTESGFKVGNSSTTGIFANGVNSEESGVAGAATRGSVFTIYTNKEDSARKEAK